jgi:hypothetical protein
MSAFTWYSIFGTVKAIGGDKRERERMTELEHSSPAHNIYPL